MKRLYVLSVVIGLFAIVNAQVLVPITWTAYGLTFNAPKGILVEEDTEDTFLLNSSRFYINIQSLDSDDITKGDLPELLKELANDDGMLEQSKISDVDMEQFHGVLMTGIVEEDPCYSVCLMTKDAGSVFYISILYNRTDSKVVESILNSIKMEEE